MQEEEKREKIREKGMENKEEEEPDKEGKFAKKGRRRTEY